MKKIYIELSDICHLACSFCPAPKGVRGVMSLEAFTQALDSALMLTKRIALHILGDPCALPNLAHYLAIARKKGAQIELVTSGAFFHKHSPQALLSPPIHQLSISLEAGIDNAIASYATKLAPLLAHHLHNPSCFLNLRIQDSSLCQNPQALCTLLRQILQNPLSPPHTTPTTTHYTKPYRTMTYPRFLMKKGASAYGAEHFSSKRRISLGRALPQCLKAANPATHSRSK